MRDAPDLEGLLADLAAMPSDLRAAARQIAESEWRSAPPDGGFCLVEQAWHLADLEREGYGLRIRRLLAEEEPVLADFKGGQIAAERNYKAKPLEEGIASFAAARTANLAVLRSLPPEAWNRAGSQEGVGSVTLRDVPRMMLEHDASHRAEIVALVDGALRASGR